MGDAPTPTAAVGFVLDRFNAMLEGDGAHLEVVATAGDTLTVRYVGSTVGDCEACVLDPDDLEMLVGEALQRQGTGFRRVTVLR
jgi:Fe-S cluster biogenesis protein NfuA